MTTLAELTVRVAALEAALKVRPPVRGYPLDAKTSYREHPEYFCGNVRVPATHHEKFRYLMGLHSGNLPRLMTWMIDAAYEGVTSTNREKDK